MTEKLKTLMDRESDVEFAAVDVDAIVTAGDRTVRRRRVAVGVAGLTAAAVAVAGVVLFAGDEGDDRSDFVDAPLVTDVPMWTVGSTLHTPDRTYELGVDVVSFVRTTQGIAFVGDDNGVYAFTGGEPERIGTLRGGEDELPFLASDTDGSLVGWSDGSEAGPALVVHDLATGEATRYDEHVGGPASADVPAAYVFAIDGSTAYWLDDRGTVATDLDTGEARVLAPLPDLSFVIAAEDGLTLTLAEDRSGGDLGTDLVDEDGRVLLGHRDTATLGSISTDGRWAASVDGPSVWEVRTGEQVPLAIGGFDGVGYDWLDGDTLMAVADGEGDTARLLQCEVPAGTCIEVTTLDVENAGHFAVASAGPLLGLQRSGGEVSGSTGSSSGDVTVVEECTPSPEGDEACTTTTRSTDADPAG